MKKTAIAVLISGTGSNLQALIDAQKELNYKVALVVSNKADAYGIKRAKTAGIKTVVIEHTKYLDRSAFDTALIQTIEAHNIKIVILAGFMRILSKEFTQHFIGKILNIHPSLLPKYPGLNAHQKVINNQDTEHGLSIHFVNAELDAGPIIKQAKFRVTADDNIESLKQKMHLLEHKHYPQVVDWLVQNKL